MVPSVEYARAISRSLRIGLLRFRITPNALLIVPAVNKGNMLRGGFGHAFRRLCCIPQCTDAHRCPAGESCPYKLIFEPSPPPRSERLSKNQDIPRPFIFRPPATTQTHFERGQSFEFDLVLVGRALEYIPYFVLAFRELAEGGLGLNRARCVLDRVWSMPISRRVHTQPGPGSTRTDSQQNDGNESEPTSPLIESSSALLYSAEDQLFRSVEGDDSSGWIESRVAQFISQYGLSECASNASCLRPESSFTLKFLTPTVIRADGQITQEPEFHQVFKRLRDRINALSTFFGEGPLDADFKGLGERSERVRRVASHFEWLDRARTSGKTGQRHELSGFVGEATYEGDLEEFLPWLAMGELVNVGRYTAWGNGRFEMAVGS